MEQYINSACEQFRKLLTEQLARTEAMEKGSQKKDYLKAEKIVIGIIGGDGIGPIIVNEAKRLIEFLLGSEVVSGRVEFNLIEGLTIENRLALG